MTQLVSHVAPPSAENACSHRHDVSVMSDQMNRLTMRVPANVSCPKNVPRPSSKPPTIGVCTVPRTLSAP